MIDTSHIPGLDLGGFLIPGNNGLPDLYVHAYDPAGWVSMQVAARAATQEPSVAAEASAAAIQTEMPEWLKKIEDVTIKRMGISLGDYITGAKVAIIGVLIGILLLAFGAYQLTKD
jgi:hypothetical protein